MHSKSVLIIFVKNAEPGKVKTRLADTVGEDKALAVYRQLLGYTRQITQPLNVDKQVWYSEFIETGDGWNPQHFIKKVQKGNDLGERMKKAFGEVFREGYRKAVIIGSDCGELTTGLIQKAFTAIDTHDVVVGPSVDGGYYLLGMTDFHPRLFEDIVWSTPRVFEQTKNKIEHEGLNWCALPELNDVDSEADWEEVKDRFSLS